MTADLLQQIASDFVEQSSDNRVPADRAFREDLAGMRIYNPPIFGFASATDEYLAELADNQQANLWLKQPAEWLESAQTVISFFLPFTEQVRKSNRTDMSYPSHEWMHARIEGQQFIVALSRHLQSVLVQNGNQVVVPLLDQRFSGSTGYDPKADRNFTSNWSERHVAWACGLGTFALSKGLITRVGIAGRLGSLITDLALPATQRPYTELYEYCTMCGACVRNCPVQAISLEQGKQHRPCAAFVNSVLNDHAPYYGCGKCQVRVPCESRIPKRRKIA